jgi:hypothetical protein
VIRGSAKGPATRASDSPSSKSIPTRPAPKIRFRATLLRPASTGKAVSWSFLTLPQVASKQLPSRGQVTVKGTINGLAFQATLEPDGEGGHWLKVDRKLREAAGLQRDEESVTLEIVPVAPADEPEPRVPPDMRKALASAPARAKEVWKDITPVARRDWIQWIVSAKQAETRARRITNACDMLAKGKRRPCCFDRSGMYGKSMTCPVADTPIGDATSRTGAGMKAPKGKDRE